jgi:uncharacterized protein (UPF0371 family)
MRKLSCSPTTDRAVVDVALRRAEETGGPAIAIELNDGRIVTGKTTSLLGASAAALLNALKLLAGIDKEEDIISPEILAPIQVLKTDHLGNHNPRLHTDEVLVALSVCAVNSPDAERAIEQLANLRGCDAHSTVILSHTDENLLKKLGVNITYEPYYQTKTLYHKK